MQNSYLQSTDQGSDLFQEQPQFLSGNIGKIFEIYGFFKKKLPSYSKLVSFIPSKPVFTSSVSAELKELMSNGETPLGLVCSWAFLAGKENLGFSNCLKWRKISKCLFEDMEGTAVSWLFWSDHQILCVGTPYEAL